MFHPCLNAAPSTPTITSASSRTPTSIFLVWDQPGDPVKSYEINYNIITPSMNVLV